MMHKRHMQNNYIILKYYLPSHQHNCNIGQKGPSFQSNRILEACCQLTTLWPAWPRHRRKTTFYEDASSDVEIGVSRWVPGLLSEVDETAVKLRCPWLYGSCNLRHVHRCIVVQQQWTLGQHSPPIFRKCLAQIFQQFTVVWSSHGYLMWKVIHQQHTFAIQQNRAMTFPADRWVRNFLGELACF